MIVSANYLGHKSMQAGHFIMLTDFKNITGLDLAASSTFLFAITYVLVYSAIVAKRPRLKRADP
jgi:hypothetical protein